MHLLNLIFVSLILISCAGKTPKSSDKKSADIIYFNGDIVTMEKDLPHAEAIAVSNGRIMAVGTFEELHSYQGTDTKMIDLKKKTMVPGFIDGHSHIGGYVGIWGLPELNPPPVSDVKSINDIIKKMQRYIAEAKIPPGQMVLGNGYDDSLLKEKRHPTASELDLISTQHPVAIIHASGHLAVGNHRSLELAGFTDASKAPKGGRINIDSKTGRPNGIVEEQAVFALLKELPTPSLEESLERLEQVQNFYASMGVTTAQEGQTLAPTLKLLQVAAQKERLKIDIVSYPKWTDYTDVFLGNKKLDINYFPPGSENAQSVIHAHPTEESFVLPEMEGKKRPNIGIYQNRLKIAGIKITGDGSPQGKTAFLSKPYLHPPKKEKASYRGYPIMPQANLDQWVDALYRNDVQLLMHCNGDAAADMMISAFEKAEKKYGKKNLRPVMIHAQTVRDDQLDKMKKLGIIPSFFSAHTFYWGDWHLKETLGKKRAFHISPMATALRKDMIMANHTDAPVIPPDQLRVIDSAVNRTTRSGVVLGPDERISAYDSLKAVTLGGAHLYFEENVKGSIRPGKLADLVILSANPLKVPSRTIKDISVLETIKEGNTIFLKENQ